MKRFIFRLLGKDPDAVVVSFCSGPNELASRMVAEVRQLVPDRQHYAVTTEPIQGVICLSPGEARAALRRKRIGLAPTLFFTGPEYVEIRALARQLAPLRILAYNRALERHHLKLSEPVASALFLRGVPLDRIWLRPSWIPFRRERSRKPETHVVVEGRPLCNGRPRVAVLSPYFPYPLSHGGAVRIFNILREAAREFDIFLFAFTQNPHTDAHNTPVTDFCAKVILFENPRYREPRWSTIEPPEVREFTAPYVGATVASTCQRYNVNLLQTEYTQMAHYGRDILVEHDITFDLYDQTHERHRSISSWWNLWRWRRFELRALRRYSRVVVMSDRDATLLNTPTAVVVPNGVDLDRFRPAPAPPADDRNLLFIGSFAHFPNVVAVRWFLEEVLPLLPDSSVRVTIIAGRNPELYWTSPVADRRVEIHGFIEDVRPFYRDASLVVVPTRVSAGTNLKVIEAMAMQRAVVSTTSGVNGLAVRDQEHVLLADTAREFAAAITSLHNHPEQRDALARRAREQAERLYSWSNIAKIQTNLWRKLLQQKSGIVIRQGTYADVESLQRIQAASHGASQWEPDVYFQYRVLVAEHRRNVVGFLVSRVVAPAEAEVLNIAVDPQSRGQGIATALLESLEEPDVFLEVRESNARAQSLYRKLGYQVVGRRPDYYDDPVETALIMRRTSNPLSSK